MTSVSAADAAAITAATTAATTAIATTAATDTTAATAVTAITAVTAERHWLGRRPLKCGHSFLCNVLSKPDKVTDRFNHMTSSVSYMVSGLLSVFYTSYVVKHFMLFSLCTYTYCGH